MPKKFRSLIFCTGIKYGGKLEWSFVFEQYKSENETKLKKELQFGLSCSKETWQVNTYLNLQLNQKYTQEKDRLLGLGYAVSRSSLLAWNFVQNNWEELSKKYIFKTR